MPAQRTLLWIWAALLCCIVAGSLLPGSSPVMATVGRLHIGDKWEHGAAYLSVSLLAVAAFQTRRKGIAVGLSMFAVGVLLEVAQHFAPGRSMEAGDVLADGMGVVLGIVLGIPVRSSM